MGNYYTKLIKFKTTTEYELLEQFKSNLEFDLPSWQTESKNSNEIVIMINGFLEGTEREPKKRNASLIRYKYIAEQLLEKNIASVMLPLPFHFERSKDFDDSQDLAPVERLKENGSYLYLGGYTQVIKDMSELIKLINAKPSLFGLREDRAPSIHLLGYSLGGAAAIGSCLKFGEESKFKSLTVLLSSWNLSKIDPDSIQTKFKDEYNFGKNEWLKMLEELRSIRSDQIFNTLVWGEGNLPELEKSAERVMFIHGLQDEIFKRELTQKLSNEILGGLNNEKYTFILMPSDHSAINTRRQISGYVSTFISGR